MALTRLPRRNARQARCKLAILTILELLKHLISAKHAAKSHKSLYLIRGQSELEILHFKLRLYLDLGLANETRIMQLQAQIAEIGRMLGGWLKSVK